MGKAIPGEFESILSLQAGWGNAKDAAFVAAIWAKESNFESRPINDHGPAQLTGWWKENHPELIHQLAYDDFGRPANHPNRQRRFAGSVVNNVLTLGNIVRFQRDHHGGNETLMAATYGPVMGDQTYTSQVLGWYQAYQPYFSCLGGK